MRLGSLCSGYGGLDLAVEAVFGAETVWQSENDEFASKVLAAHWDVPNLGDMKLVDWSCVEPVDVLTAGYPCQPFSSAGSRRGVEDERHLWPFVREAIRQLRPGFTFLENVAGHRSCGSVEFLGTWPRTGWMHGGLVCELPMLGHRTGGKDSLSLFGTPRAEERCQVNSGDNWMSVSKAVTLLPR